MKIFVPSSIEQVINKKNEIIPVNEIKNSYLTEDNGSKLIHEITQKEIKENEFTGTNIYDNSNWMNGSGE